MTPQFSPHAQFLFQDILLAIEEKLSYEDAVRWHDKIIGDIAQLEHYPFSCPNVPLECFNTLPPNPERLHQLIVNPYRIVYEVVGDKVHILSIRHSRMLVAGTDTYWN